MVGKLFTQHPPLVTKTQGLAPGVSIALSKKGTKETNKLLEEYRKTISLSCPKYNLNHHITIRSQATWICAWLARNTVATILYLFPPPTSMHLRNCTPTVRLLASRTRPPSPGILESLGLLKVSLHSHSAQAFGTCQWF